MLRMEISEGCVLCYLTAGIFKLQREESQSSFMYGYVVYRRAQTVILSKTPGGTQSIRCFTKGMGSSTSYFEQYLLEFLQQSSIVQSLKNCSSTQTVISNEAERTSRIMPAVKWSPYACHFSKCPQTPGKGFWSLSILEAEWHYGFHLQLEQRIWGFK